MSIHTQFTETLDKTANRSVPIRELFCYSMGGFATFMVMHITNSFLNFYWTDIMGIPIALVSSMMLFSKLWDAINDPIVGALADRTNTKMGRYRPWLWAFIPTLITTLLMFVMLPGASTSAQTIFVFSMYFLQVLALTALQIPHMSMIPAISTNYQARGTLAAWRQTGSTGGMILISALFLPMVAMFGKGDQARGYFNAIVFFFALSIPLFLICIFGTKEYVLPSPENKEKIPFLSYFKCLKGNLPAILLALAYLSWGLGSGISTTARIYYSAYVVGDTGFFSINMTIMAFGGLLGGVALGVFAKYVKNRRNIGIACWALSCAFYIWQFFVPVQTDAGRQMFHILTFINGLFAYSGMVCLVSLAPDVTEYTQVKYGLRASGFLWSVINFCQKLGAALTTGLFGWIIGSLGYIPNVAQNSAVVTATNASVTLIPGFTTLLGVICFVLFKLNRETHEADLAKLEA